MSCIFYICLDIFKLKYNFTNSHLWEIPQLHIHTQHIKNSANGDFPDFWFNYFLVDIGGWFLTQFRRYSFLVIPRASERAIIFVHFVNISQFNVIWVTKMIEIIRNLVDFYVIWQKSIMERLENSQIKNLASVNLGWKSTKKVTEIKQGNFNDGWQRQWQE